MKEIYIIEGLDGVGKTSVAKQLAKRFDAEYYHTPPKEYKKLSKFMDEKADNFARFLFYYSSIVQSSKEIDENKNDTFFVDRYVESTISYHNALLGKTLDSYIDPNLILKPTEIFYLTADKKIRQNRLKSRGLNSYTDWATINDRSYLAKIEKGYERLCSKNHIIDTSLFSLDEVVNHISKKIKLIRKGGIKNKPYNFWVNL